MGAVYLIRKLRLYKGMAPTMEVTLGCIVVVVLSSLHVSRVQGDPDPIILNVPAGGSGQITSPNYPNDYPNGADVTWVLEAMEGDVLYLLIDELKIESNAKCTADWLKIDGEKLCGIKTGHLIKSERNVVNIEFHSDGGGTHPGFSLSYSVTPPVLPTIAPSIKVEPGETGHLFSPNYPDDYYNFENQTWVLETREGYVIDLLINDLGIEYDAICEYDWLKIDGEKLCGTKTDYLIKSKGNVVDIEFHSDSAYTGRGFNLTYSVPRPGAECEEDSLSDCYEKLEDLKISYGSPHPDAFTPCLCADLCNAAATCAGFDFNYDDPAYRDTPCWLHTSSQDEDLVPPYMNVAHFRRTNIRC